MSLHLKCFMSRVCGSLLWGVVSFGVLALGLESLSAAPRAGNQEGIQLLDIGVIGLTSHDLISWDREKKALREERGRLNLSTLYDWVDDRTGKNLWQTGGDPKNSENAPVFSVVQHLLQTHRTQEDWELANGATPELAFALAREFTTKEYLKMVKVSYERLFGLEFPKEPIREGTVSAEEHAAMRAAHHILPGKMLVSFGPMKRELAVTDFRYAQMRLSTEDLRQPVKKFSGAYAEEYLTFSIPFGPRAGEKQNLYAIDKEFVEAHTSFKFDDLLLELKEKGSFKGTSLEDEIHSLYAEGLDF